MRRVLRIRDARIFLFGWTLSQFGDWAMFIVLGVWMKDLTGSNSAAGLIFFALAAPSLFFVHDRSDVWLLYAVTVFYGFSGLLAGSARSALMTVIVPRDLLAEANGIFQTVREGLRLIVRTSALAQIILTCSVCLLVVGFSETVIFAVLDQGLHRPTSFFGVLSSLQGVGAIAGGVTAARVLRRIGDAKLVGLGMALFAIGELAFVSSSLAPLLVGVAVAGAGIAWLIVGFATAIQVRTPARLQGRVAAAADTAVSTPQTVSIALSLVRGEVVQ